MKKKKAMEVDEKKRERIKFFKQEMADYEAPDGRIRKLIRKIGWEPLFSETSILKQRIIIDKNRRRLLLDFFSSYDPSTHSGFAGGVRVFLTRQTIARTFGFAEVPEGELRKVPLRGSSNYRCDLLKKEARPTSKGMPLHFVKDDDVRRMLQAANRMLTGKPTSGSIVMFGMLQAVWESMQRGGGGTRYDWAAFMLANMTAHLKLSQTRLESAPTMRLFLGWQIIAVLEEVSAATALVAAVPISSDPITITSEPEPLAVAYHDEDVDIDVVGLDDDFDDLHDIVELDGVNVDDQAQPMSVDVVKDENYVDQAQDQVESPQLDVLLHLMKRTVMKLLVVRSGGGETSILEQEQMEEMQKQLHNLIAKATVLGGGGDDPEIRRLELKLQCLQAEDAALKQKLHKFGEQNALLRSKLELIPDDVSSLWNTLRSLTAENTDLKSKLQKLESEKASLLSEVQKLESEKANSTLEGANAEIEELLKKASVLEAENEKLTRFFIDDEWRRKAEKLEAEKFKLELELEKLRSEFRQVLGPYREVHISLGEQQAENARLKKRIQELEELKVANEYLRKNLVVCIDELDGLKVDRADFERRFLGPGVSWNFGKLLEFVKSNEKKREVVELSRSFAKITKPE